MSQDQGIVSSKPRDHGGGVDAAVCRFGGDRSDWLDLSTGINPRPYPVTGLERGDWTALPDQDAQDALTHAARRFWQVPDRAAILAAPGASSLIARLPSLAAPARVGITAPTYNEHAASFRAAGWQVSQAADVTARVLVHPNNPDGRLWSISDADAALTIIDESFCDTRPDQSLIATATRPGCVILKSFGKFWGLAGMRLGFAIGDPALIDRLAETLGPWPVAGPALRIGRAALQDPDWAEATRTRLTEDSARLDDMITATGAVLVGGTSLFRLYKVTSAAALQQQLAQRHIWTRIFPYSDHLIRLGLPDGDGWARLAAAL